jgi:hypothetical protein
MVEKEIPIFGASEFTLGMEDVERFRASVPEILSGAQQAIDAGFAVKFHEGLKAKAKEQLSFLEAFDDETILGIAGSMFVAGKELEESGLSPIEVARSLDEQMPELAVLLYDLIFRDTTPSVPRWGYRLGQLVMLITSGASRLTNEEVL